jgi:hypothetical protein
MKNVELLPLLADFDPFNSLGLFRQLFASELNDTVADQECRIAERLFSAGKVLQVVPLKVLPEVLCSFESEVRREIDEVFFACS